MARSSSVDSVYRVLNSGYYVKVQQLRHWCNNKWEERRRSWSFKTRVTVRLKNLQINTQSAWKAKQLSKSSLDAIPEQLGLPFVAATQYPLLLARDAQQTSDSTLADTLALVRKAYTYIIWGGMFILVTTTTPRRKSFGEDLEDMLVYTRLRQMTFYRHPCKFLSWLIE